MLKIKNLSLSYRSSGRTVIEKLNLSINKGEVVAILGPSGCGKTTLLNYVQGKNIRKEMSASGLFKLNKNVSVRTVFQEPRLLPWRNALKNVSYSLEAKGKEKTVALAKAEIVLKSVGLQEFVNYYPAELSIGMKQRVNFARAIISEPDILLLDEPFSSLDDATKYQLLEQFKETISQGEITTIFVTHDKQEAVYLADRIITLQGTPATILTEEKVKRQLNRKKVIRNLEYEF